MCIYTKRKPTKKELSEALRRAWPSEKYIYFDNICNCIDMDKEPLDGFEIKTKLANDDQKGFAYYTDFSFYDNGKCLDGEGEEWFVHEMLFAEELAKAMNEDVIADDYFSHPGEYEFRSRFTPDGKQTFVNFNEDTGEILEEWPIEEDPLYNYKDGEENE